MTVPYLAVAAGCVSAAYMVVAGWRHLAGATSAPLVFARLLKINRGAARRFELGLGIVELAVGGGVLLGLLLVGEALTAAALAVLAALYGAYLAYVVVLRLRQSDIPCGCSSDAGR